MEVSMILDFLANFAVGNAKLAGFCTIAYTVGLGAKIVREGVEKFVSQTESQEDDKKLAEVQGSKAYKAVSFILDLLFRLKKPKM